VGASALAEPRFGLLSARDVLAVDGRSPCVFEVAGGVAVIVCVLTDCILLAAEPPLKLTAALQNEEDHGDQSCPKTYSNEEAGHQKETT
jgi:hypothetical protein